MVCKSDNFEQIGYISTKGITIRRRASLDRWLEFSDAQESAPEGDTIAFAPPPPPKKIVAD